MSLDQLLNQTKKADTTSLFVKDIELYLPPEYMLGLDQWRALFATYNRTGLLTKTALAIEKYILEHNPNVLTKDLFTVTEVEERNECFYVNAAFKKSKAALTALYIYNAEEQVRLLPIVPINGNGQIAHIVLSYVPE